MRTAAGMEHEARGVYILVEDNVILKDILDRGIAQGRAEGREEGRAEGRAEMLEMLREVLSQKLPTLPAWAETQLRDATPADLVSLGKRAMWARTLEDVFGTALDGAFERAGEGEADGRPRPQ